MWLEKILDKQRFQHINWLTLSYIIGVGKALISSVLLARLFGPTMFGEYTYILAIFYVANVFGAPGLSIALFRSVAKGFHGSLLPVTKVVFYYSLLGSLFLAFTSIYSFFFTSLHQSLIFLFLALIFPLTSIGINYSYFLSGAELFRTRALYEAILNLVSLGLLVLTIFLTDNLVTIIISSVLPATLLNGFYLLHLIKKNSTKEIDGEVLSYGKKINFNYFLPTIKAQIDRILTPLFFGYTLTAQYGIAAAINDQYLAVSKIFSTALFPQASNLSLNDLKKKVRHKSLLTFTFFTFFSFIGAALLPYAIPFVFGSEYKESVPYAQVFLLAGPIFSANIFFRSLHESQKHTHTLFIISNHLVILEFILMLLGVYTFGIWGIIGGKIIAELVKLAYQSRTLYSKLA